MDTCEEVTFDHLVKMVNQHEETIAQLVAIIGKTNYKVNNVINEGNKNLIKAR